MSCSALDLLKTSHDPGVNTVLPPSYCSQPTFSKKVDYYGNWTIATPAVGDDTVFNPTSGVVLWHTARGINSISRYAIIPSGYNTLASTYMIEPTLFNTDVLIPFVASENVTISPMADISTSIARCRLYSGRVTLVADTVPLGAFSINGSLAATAVSDSRIVTVCNTGFDGSKTDVCTVSDMVQFATTMKDSVKEVSVTTGVTAVIGADIPQEFTPPDGSLFFPHDEVQLDIATQALTPLTPPAVPIDHDSDHQFIKAWVSPYDTLVTSYTDNIQIPRATRGATSCIMGTSYRFHLSCVLEHALGAVPGDFEMETWSMRFVDMYVAAAADGTIVVTSVESDYTGGSWNPWATPKNMAAVHSTGLARGAWSEPSGVYLGTYINVEMRVTGNTANNGVSTFKSASLTITDETSYGAGHTGPARVMRYDGLSVGQSIRLTGVALAECLPAVSAAAFVQSGCTMSRACENMNSLSFLSFAYNLFDTPFKRTWAHDEWKEFLTNDLRVLAPDTIRSYGNAKLTVSAIGAGILSGGTCETRCSGGVCGGTTTACCKPTSGGCGMPSLMSLRNSGGGGAYVDDDTRSVMSAGKRTRTPQDLADAVDIVTGRGSTMNAYPATLPISDRWRDLDNRMAPYTQRMSSSTRQKRNGI